MDTFVSWGQETGGIKELCPWKNFFLVTACGAHIPVGVGVNVNSHHWSYTVDRSFIQGYGGRYGCRDRSSWGLRKQFIAWLNSVIVQSPIPANVPSSFAFIMNGITPSTKVRIPIKFRARIISTLRNSTVHSNKLPCTASLGDMENVWHIQIDNMTFTDGWSRLVDESRITPDDFVVFHHIDDLVFWIAIMDNTGCRKEFDPTNADEVSPFFHIVTPLDSQSLVLPIPIATYWSLSGVSNVMLKKKSERQLVSIAGGKFTAGWSEFYKACRLASGQTLVFADDREGSVDVMVFDENLMASTV